MANKPLPPLDFLRECFDYNPVNGRVVWRQRPEHHFTDRSRGLGWNTKYAGLAGVTDPRGYRKFQISYRGGTRKLSAHRVAYALHHGVVSFGELDHEDGNPENNKPGNLRLATRGQNNANRKRYSKSGLPKGVYKHGGRYMALAAAGAGKTAYLGRHDTPEAAHAAFCEFAEKRHGGFFRA